MSGDAAGDTPAAPDAVPQVDPATVEEVEVPKGTPVVLSLGQRVRRLKVVFLLIFLLGASSAAAAPNVPQLITDTFGGNSYLVSGLFSSAKGMLACVYAPTIGSLSDGKNRRWALLLAFISSTIAPVAYLCTSSYWVFAGVDTILGLSGPVLSLLMTCVTDYIPATCPARTESFAMTMFFFLIGVAFGPFASLAISTYYSFAFSAVLLVGANLITWFLLPRAGRYRDEDEAIARQYLDSHVPGTCPVLPTGRLANMIAGEQGADERRLLNTSDASEPGNAQQADYLAAAPAAATVGGTDGITSIDINGGDSETSTLVADGERPPETLMRTLKAAVRRMVHVFKAHRSLRLVLAIVFWSCMCQEALESSLTLYLQRRVGFTNHDLVPFIAIVALGGLISLGLVVPLLRRWVGTLRTLQLGILGNIFFAAGLALLYTKWMAYSVCVFGILGYGVFPCSSSLVAHVVPHESAGAAQGILSAMRMLAQGIGPVIFGLVFHFTQYSSVPGASYVVGAVCGVVALIVAYIVSRMVALP